MENYGFVTEMMVFLLFFLCVCVCVFDECLLDLNENSFPLNGTHWRDFLILTVRFNVFRVFEKKKRYFLSWIVVNGAQIHFTGAQNVVTVSFCCWNPRISGYFVPTLQNTYKNETEPVQNQNDVNPKVLWWNKTGKGKWRIRQTFP